MADPKECPDCHGSGCIVDVIHSEWPDGAYRQYFNPLLGGRCKGSGWIVNLIMDESMQKRYFEGGGHV